MRTVMMRLTWRALRRIFGLLLLVALVLGGTGAAIVVQGGRDEADRADTAVVMTDGDPLSQAARVDRAVELYLNGQVSRIIVLGVDPGDVQATLLNRGVQTVKLVTIRAATQREQFDALGPIFTADRAADALLIAEPVEMLRLLKIGHDRGLPLRSAPTSRNAQITMGMVIDEIRAYIRYVFAGR